MNEKDYKDLKPNTNSNIDIDIKIIENKSSKKKKIIIFLIIFSILILIGNILITIFYSKSSDDSTSDDLTYTDDLIYSVNLISSNDSTFTFSDDSNIKSVEGKIIEKEKNIEKIKIAKYNTVIKLGDLNLSSFTSNYNYNEEYLKSYYNFTINFFELINYTDYSPVTLYSILINLYMSISDNEESKKLNEILGLDNDERLIFYKQIFQNNYFSNSDGEIKINNGAFYNSDNAKENIAFINNINNTYTECYKLSYKKDFNFILDWINYSIKEKDFIKNSSFKNIESITIILISSLYFNQKWSEKFIDLDTYKNKFYINNNYKEVYFMRHSYSINYYYDYGTYISFYDFYSNEYSIQYLIPKTINKNTINYKNDNSSKILNLIKDINFLEENESNKKKINIIDLSVPKLKKITDIDFIPVLKKLGLEKLFNKNFSTVENPFIVEKGYNYYVSQFFQKNKIELNEDGTIIKSVAVDVDGLITSDFVDYVEELTIILNQPFIYIIKDKNKLPIYIGYVNEPSYE